jgi:hypothetical protein
MYPVIFGFLLHQLIRFAKSQGGTKTCTRENCRLSSTRQPSPYSS